MDQHNQPKQAMGGDDDIEEIEEPPPKPPNLEKHMLEPDKNIRTTFWELMGRCKKKEKIEIKDEETMAIIRTLITIIISKEKAAVPLPKREMVRCILNALKEKGEEEVKALLLTCGEHEKSAKMIGEAIGKDEIPLIKKLLRNRREGEAILNILQYIKDKELLKELKVELLIFARGDVGENQYRAIRALKNIREDIDIKETLIMLLSHWDEGARMEAAKALEGMEDSRIKSVAEMRVNIEENEKVKKILKRLVK